MQVVIVMCHFAYFSGPWVLATLIQPTLKQIRKHLEHLKCLQSRIPISAVVVLNPARLGNATVASGFTLPFFSQWKKSATFVNQIRGLYSSEIREREGKRPEICPRTTIRNLNRKQQARTLSVFEPLDLCSVRFLRGNQKNEKKTRTLTQ